MIKLKSLLSEVKLNFANEVTPEQKQMATKALNYYLSHEWPIIDDAAGKMSSRFEFELARIKESGSEIIFEFKYYEIGGRSKMMSAYENSPRMLKHKYHRDISSAVAGIQKNENSVYRGMSFEEALNIKKRGYILTNSSLTLGDSQEGYTFFGEDPKTAHFYANGFQPLPLKGTRNKPPVIIEISKDYVEPANITINKKTKLPVGTNREWVSNQPIPVDAITNVWFIVSIYSSPGEFDVIYDKRYENFHTGGGSSVSTKSIIISKPDFFK